MQSREVANSLKNKVIKSQDKEVANSLKNKVIKSQDKEIKTQRSCSKTYEK